MISHETLLQSILPASLTDARVFVITSHNHRGRNLLAFGVEDEFVMEEHADKNALTDFQDWLDKKKDWVFGYVSYDLKNCIEELETSALNLTGAALLHFIRPKTVVEHFPESGAISFLKSGNGQENNPDFKEKILELFQHLSVSVALDTHRNNLKPRISKEQYIEAVTHLKNHIQQGDIYEANYCQEFFLEEKIIHPFLVWQRLNALTEAPFAAFVQTGEFYLLSASPERYIKKEGLKIISQPIKGTIKRGHTEEEELQLKQQLIGSEKERSENVMIVDLVRNDLSKSAVRGSVSVEELFGVHTFKTVHHLISTVSARVKEHTTFTQILKDTFPMGSMTGAPKIRAMQLIDAYEYAHRGLYSGSVGYINPEGDFDFNVVIRSIVYNASLPYISCSVGSAITSQSEAEMEYEECLLKAKAIMKALQS